MSKVLYYDKFNKVDLENDQNLLKKFNAIISDLEKDNYIKQGNLKLIIADDGVRYLRAKLSDADRLLFTCIQHEGGYSYVILEVILNHNYHKSKFLAHKKKIKSIKILDQNTKEVFEDGDRIELTECSKFSFLGTVIFFTATQEDIIKNIKNNKLPLVVNGCPGSGKTSVALESLKKLGEKLNEEMILYITRSEYLLKESKKMLEYEYYDENNKKFKIDILNKSKFLSLDKFLQSLTEDIKGKKPINRSKFFLWFKEKCQGNKFKHYAKDGDKILEEFTAVIAGRGLQEAEYKKLGARQAIFTEGRHDIYCLFKDYKKFIEEDLEYYDPNLIAIKCDPKKIYDSIVVDEVQDFTESTLSLLLRSLKDESKDNFLLCGDTNQVIHPSFFSLSRLKSFLKKNSIDKEIPIFSLEKDYRNSQRVIELANRLLHFKNYCFAPEDKMTENEKEAFFIKSDTKNIGSVSFIVDYNSDKIKEISEKVFKSTNWAILVLSNDNKEEAKKLFKTPLVFNIHEAKGLEFENVILYKFTSHESYNRLWQIVSPSKNKRDIQKFIDTIRESFERKEINVSRSKNKSDKSFEELKFYMNALYVGVTRAVNSVCVIDNVSNLLRTIEVREKCDTNIDADKSSSETWKNLALRLIEKGNIEQAKDILKSKLSHNSKYIVEISNALKSNSHSRESSEMILMNKNEKGAQKSNQVEKNTAYLFEDLKKKDKKSALKLAKKDFDIHMCTSFLRKEGWSLLHLAAFSDNTELLEKFCNTTGVDINCINSAAETPLHIASQFFSKNAVKFLISRGADVNAKNKDGYTILHYIFLSSVDLFDVEVLVHLIKRGALVDSISDDGRTPLYFAVKHGFKDAVKFLFSEGANIHYLNNESPTLLRCAFENNHDDIAEFIIDKVANIYQDINSDISFLHLAVEKGYKDIVNLLLDRGADINCLVCEEFTPLFVAIKDDREDIVELLIKRGANLNFKTSGDASYLHSAVKYNRRYIVKILIAKLNVNIIDSEGMTPLHIAVENGYEDIVELLIAEEETDIYRTSNEGMTPLHIAVENGYINIIKLLVERRNFDVNFPDVFGNNPLLYAMISSSNNKKEIINYLEEKGAMIKFTPEKEHPDFIKYGILFHELYIAVLLGDLKSAKKILQNRINVNLQCEKGFSLLHFAVANSHESMIQLLLEKGANISIDANISCTPLHCAILKYDDEIVKLLIERGANVNIMHDTITQGDYDIVKQSIKEEENIMLNLLSERIFDLTFKHPNFNVGKIKISSVKDINRRKKVGAKFSQDFRLFQKLKEVESLEEIDDKFIQDLKELLNSLLRLSDDSSKDQYGLKPSLSYRPDRNGESSSIEIVMKSSGQIVEIFCCYAEEHIGTDTEIYEQLKKVKEQKSKPANDLGNPFITSSNLFFRVN